MNILEFLSTSIVLPVLIAIATYLCVNHLKTIKDRKNTSLLGVAILNSLIEEVKTGKEIMSSVLRKNFEEIDTRNPPNESWINSNTIPDNVLLRIIAVSKKYKSQNFHPSEIRIHCKNYFKMMITNWLNANNSKELKPNFIRKTTLPTYAEASTKVLAMLEETKALLEENSEKVFPK
jgi:hypothetical protein